MHSSTAGRSAVVASRMMTVRSLLALELAAENAAGRWFGRFSPLSLRPVKDSIKWRLFIRTVRHSDERWRRRAHGLCRS